MKKKFVPLLLALAMLCTLLPISAAAQTTLARPVVSIATDAPTGYPKLTWKAVSGADWYEIYRCSDTGTYYWYHDTVTATSYIDDDAWVEGLFKYKVVAVNSRTGTESGESNAVGKTCRLAQPKVTATNVVSTGQVKLQWEYVNGAAKYAIYRRTGSSGDYAYYAGTTGTSYVDKKATVGTTYCYKVTAVRSGNSAANSEKSAAVGKTPKLAKPKVSIANVVSSGKIKLSWGAVSGAQKYAIYRAVGNGSYKYYVSTKSTAYIDSNVKAGTKYAYKVTAVHSKSAGNSEKSAAVGKTAKLPQTKVTATNVVSTGKIKLTWNAVSGAKKYAIYRMCSDYDYDYEYYTSTTSTAYVDKGADEEFKYCYKVVAVHSNSAGNSAPSAAVGKTCKLAQPKVTISTDSFTGNPYLIWNSVNDVMEYDIYRRVGSSGSFKYHDTVPDYQTYYSDGATAVGKKYTYKVYAVSYLASATSAPSAAVAKTCALPAPDDICIKIDNTYPRVSWDRVGGAKKYNVYRATSELGTYKLIGSTTSLSYRDTGVSRSAKYYYRIKAVHSNAAATSGYSTLKGIDIKLALQSDPYDIAACAMDACYDLAKFPSSVYLERAYYTDSSSIDRPTVILECSAQNGLGGYGIIYITATAMSEDDYYAGAASSCDISYTVDDYRVACTGYENVSVDYTGYRKLTNSKVMDAYYDTDYEY